MPVGDDTVLSRLAVMESRFGEFEDRMEKLLEEIKTEVRTSTGLYNGQQLTCVARGVQLTQTAKTVEELEKRMKRLEELYPAIRIIMWVGAIIGTSIIVLIWSLITGQASIVFK